MDESDFNTLSQDIQIKNENNEDMKDKRKTLVVIMIIFIGQTMSILNTLINSFTTKTFQYKYPILYYGGFYFFFFLVWMCINRKIKEPKRYYYLIILLETQSFFFDYLANYSYTSNNDSQEQEIINTGIPNMTLFFNNIKIDKDKNPLDNDNKFRISYPSYINFPSQFIFTFILFLIFLKKKYYLRKRHYFSLFLGITSVGMFSYFYIHNYINDSLSIFNELSKSSKAKVIIFTFLSNILLSSSYILQEHFFKSGQEIYDFFPYKAFLSMIILGFESFCAGEFQFVNKEIFKNKDIALNFLYFCILNIIYLSVIPFLIKHITSVMLVTNYINYLFYYYIFYLSKRNFLQNYGLLIIFGLIMNLFSFYIFVKYKAKKSYQNMKETIEKLNYGGLLHDPGKYDINRTDSNNSTNVEMNLQISNNPLDNLNDLK
jgi:hypothetical protein